MEGVSSNHYCQPWPVSPSPAVVRVSIAEVGENFAAGRSATTPSDLIGWPCTLLLQRNVSDTLAGQKSNSPNR
jgi:hypothetical protein